MVDWDAALVIGQGEDLDDVLHILELANVQLAELEAYDQMLDAVLEGSYHDVSRWRMTGRPTVRRRLREIRVDLAHVSDELENITKFLGDWHLARVYRDVASRFHLADWYRRVEDKLKTLGDLYEILQHDRTNFWMFILEATIVLLFILDLILLFAVKG